MARAAALLICATLARAQFQQLGDPLALINTSKPLPPDNFSVDDKLVPCNNDLVLIDLDSDKSFTGKSFTGGALHSRGVP